MHYNLVAGLPARYPGANLPDNPGSVGAADVVAELRVVAGLEDRDRLAQRGPDIVEVDAGRHYADNDLERGRFGRVNFFELEGVYRLALALLADYPSGHFVGELTGFGGDVCNC